MVNGVPVVGVRTSGFGVHVAGAAVAPATQLKLIAEENPFSALTVPLKTADWVGKMGFGEFKITIWKSGARSNCHMPRP
jgi:hypothetical protein